MRHPSLLDRSKAAVVVVDMQEAFRPIIPGFPELASRVGMLVEAAGVLDIPVMVTEQYPQGLGPTVDEIRRRLDEKSELIEKVSFSACAELDFDTRLREWHVEQVAVCGIEAHICVSQTAHDLLALGYQVHVISDALGARLERNLNVALEKLSKAGAVISSLEMALFELCGKAGTSEFKSIQRMVKDLH
jgi:nicotinamidase-related amidase